ncbi:hypothetical protein JJC00_08140 [Bradyrhizobium diazoefficiens]|uniref:hypothetical protein n=1 Tax=Bradyrhizobium diazoefficiens TaxID=1355477 RepID=UPI00190B3C2F|nr:hypothetical protein [Bradyrhizobium diazoefficiens]QQO35565.1 hypothetical protein JJC00_08140 [Bradyrhizobium diazoefficiens]
MIEPFLLKSEDMVFSQVNCNGIGHASNCQLLSPNTSKTLGVGVSTYDGCSIESTTRYDKIVMVLSGIFRILTEENYSRVIEARFGDVIWLPKGTRLKYEGEQAKVFYSLYPVDWETRGDANDEVKPTTEVLHLPASSMIFYQMQVLAGGYASTCSLIGPAISNTLGATMATFDGCSIEWTTKYDQASVGLSGTFRAVTGENFSRVMEAKLGDVIWLPKGTRLKYGGDKAVHLFVPYPINWRTSGERPRPSYWPTSVR